ncbi:diguanylate cyclase domain-containing protein [Streptomyces sp. AC512_CC834]|uniref:caspase, EACC1-associated type n=1 Tax=Streptomyces sp. AC512_CC834 TaxID=2823691 RepID=UPI0027E44639|nr:diguanylate cyclase [Streptomyces sp. AC512_CC834]
MNADLSPVASAVVPAVLPDPARTRVVLAGTSDFTELDGLPAVQGNLLALADLFRTAWGMSAQHCVSVSNPATPRDLSRAVQHAVSEATDTLLVYYAGHGLIGPRTGQLHLAVESTEPDSVHDSAVPYEWIRWEIEKSRAARRVVVLDCCYSARAFGVQSDAAALEVDGTYLLAAAAETAVALSPPGEPLTAFTGELVTVLRDGVPNGPEFLDLDTVFSRLSSRLAARERPRPQRLCRNRLGLAPFVRNRAYVPEQPAPVHASEGVQPQPTDIIVADLYTARSLADTLQAIADGAVAGLGFLQATVNLVQPEGDLVVAAIAGNAADEPLLTGRVGAREAWDRRLSMGEDWDGLRFIAHRDAEGLDVDGVPESFTALSAMPAGVWHPMDRLYAPMFTGEKSSELIGIVSLGPPKQGQRLGPAALEALRTYTFHASVAVSNARMRSYMQRALVRLERDQQALRASEESFRQIFEYAPSGVAITDMRDGERGRILRANDALCRMLGRPLSIMRRYAFMDLIHPEDLKTMMALSPEGGRSEVRLARQDGSWIWVAFSTSVVADHSDGPLFLVVHVDDIEERRRRELIMSTDPVTGLLTEPGLRLYLQRHLCPWPTTGRQAHVVDLSSGEHLFAHRGHRHKLPPGMGSTLALIRLGINSFKAVNDRFGYSAGDQVLAELAGRVTSAAAQGTVAARVGGDEFLVLADDVDVYGATELALRLSRACAHPLSVGSPDSAAFSLGTTYVLSWATCGSSWQEALHDSAQRMHEEKRAG